MLDISIPICKKFQMVADSKAPYVFEQSEFGYQFEGGPVIDLFKNMQAKASYFYSSIPGDQGAWSGQPELAGIIASQILATKLRLADRLVR